MFSIRTPGLAEIKKEYGHDFMISYLSIWISKINSFAGGNMGTEDCKEASAEIFEDFFFMTIADLKLITKRLRVRKFIRVTGNEIYREFEIYFNKRSEVASEYSRNKSEDYKNLSIDKKILDDKELNDLYESKELSKPKKDFDNRFDSHARSNSIDKAKKENEK